MHLYSWYHGSEDAEACELGEARSVVCLLLSQMAQSLHGYLTCDQYKSYSKTHHKIWTEFIF
jgi:hypothetical protein